VDVFDAIRTLLAVRRYADRPVPAAIVRRIVEAGRLTASSMNQQPWHFVVVQERDTLRKLAAEARTGPYLAQAAFAIVVAVERGSPFAVSDASRAIQSMTLAAWGEGVGSNWIGFGGMRAPSQIVALPRELDALAIVAFGYPSEQVGRGRKKRKPLGEVASRERFGQPFE
jgi:nitroreductase